MEVAKQSTAGKSIHTMSFEKLKQVSFPPSYELCPWSICNECGMPVMNACSSGHLVSSYFLGLACAQIVETRFLELAMSLVDFSP